MTTHILDLRFVGENKQELLETELAWVDANPHSAIGKILVVDADGIVTSGTIKSVQSTRRTLHLMHPERGIQFILDMYKVRINLNGRIRVEEISPGLLP